MSSYLLLRNNKESGPFTIEELKGMSLKAFDLLWVVGKSAAWRYPGEIPELKSFAPAVPEQAGDPFFKKRNPESPSSETANTKKTESPKAGDRDNHPKPAAPARAVYVDLPDNKKQSAIPEDRVLYNENPSSAKVPEPAYDFSDLYKKKPTPAVRISGKILWVSTIFLLFGAGILTGLFISDRRKFFSTDANHPQNGQAGQPAILNNQKEISPVITTNGRNASENNASSIKVDSIKPLTPASKKLVSGGGKKNLKNGAGKKDSALNQTTSLPPLNLADSPKQNTVSKTEMLYQKIKAHPTDYVNLVTGRYNTGLFGGISSFPITVTNNTPVKLDLVVVNIEYIQNNEKVFKTESLSFNDLEPGESVTLKAPKSPRGIKISTRVHVINSHQLDLSYSN